jgi:hypothetical protein
VEPDLPIFTDGYRGKVDLSGEATSKAFFLTGIYNLDFVEMWGSYDQRPYEHRCYYNPVERLVIRVRDLRTVQTPLSAVLVYAKQPDVEPIDEVEDRLPLLSPEVVTEPPFRTERAEGVTTFTFRWDHDTYLVGDTQSPPHTCVGHTFEIGLKKLVILESEVPVFACGITVPPAREYQCRATQTGANKSSGCAQLYYDAYVVEIDYEE